MKAATLFGPFDLRMQDVATPQPKPGEVLVRMKAAGVCGSDLHFYDGSHPYKNYPRTYGHELAGIIEDTASGNTAEVKKGDRVVVEPLIPCGTCYACRVGKYNCCSHLKVIGAHVEGGFADFVIVRQDKVYRIPDEVPFDIASVFEPYTIAGQCVKRGQVQIAETVLIIGCGAIGLALTDFCKAIGAVVIVADVHEYRLAKAKELGADIVIDSGKDDLLKRIREITKDEGASVVIEATGVAAIMQKTEELVAPGGRIVIVGLTNDKVAFTGINFTKNEMTILGSRNSTNMFPRVIELVSQKRLHPEKLISHRFRFSEIEEAFRYINKNLGKVSKAVIEFDGA